MNSKGGTGDGCKDAADEMFLSNVLRRKKDEDIFWEEESHALDCVGFDGTPLWFDGKCRYEWYDYGKGCGCNRWSLYTDAG